MVGRRTLLLAAGRLMLPGAGPMELLMLWFRDEFSLPLVGDRDMLELKLDTEEEDDDVFFLSVTLLPWSRGALTADEFLTLLVGGARARFPRRLELAEVSLTSDATLAESESRSSVDPPALLEA